MITFVDDLVKNIHHVHRINTNKMILKLQQLNKNFTMGGT